MTEAGLIAICAFMSPSRAERGFVRRLFERGEFIEAFVDTPLETCVERDPKGLYMRALSGEVQNLIGVHQPYEPPDNPELILRTLDNTPEELANRVVDVVLPFLSDRQQERTR